MGSRETSTGSLLSSEEDGIVCAWAAVGDVNRENGCLSFIPGSHRRGLRLHAYPKWNDKSNIGYLGIQDLEEGEFQTLVHAEMKAGDVVFFHPQTIHGSGVNKRLASDPDPDAFRKAISVHYRRKDLSRIDWSELPVGTSMVDEMTAKEILFSPIGKIVGLKTENQVEFNSFIH